MAYPRGACGDGVSNQEQSEVGGVVVHGLNLARFSRINEQRCFESFHPLESWSPTDWACALAGEVGELCNLLKKRHRGEDIAQEDIADEMGDVLAYLDLLATRCGINLSLATVRKFNAVSARVGSERVMEMPKTLGFVDLGGTMPLGEMINDAEIVMLDPETELLALPCPGCVEPVGHSTIMFEFTQTHMRMTLSLTDGTRELTMFEVEDAPYVPVGSIPVHVSSEFLIHAMDVAAPDATGPVGEVSRSSPSGDEGKEGGAA